MLLWAAVEVLGPQRVRAIFVYHGLEGSSALRESAVEISESCGVPCDVVERLIDDDGNLEDRARTARYEAMDAAIESGTVGLTGHTADDQAETVLMRLLTGSGTGALSGIPYRRGAWRRPFLGVSRATLRASAEDLELPFFDDPHNAQQRFTRAWIRHSVMPVLVRERGPGVQGLIGTSAALLGADDELLEAEASTTPIRQFRDGVSIPIGPLISCADPIASRIVRRALRMMRNENPGSALDVAAVLRVARGSPATTISDALQVVSEPAVVTIFRPGRDEAPLGREIAVGESFIWAGSQYSTRTVSRVPPSVVGGRFTMLGARAVGDKFTIRGFQPGDRIDIGTGSTPLKEVLRAASVPQRVRPHSLIVTVDGKIAALVGVRVASWARTQRSEAAVIIEREVATWT
jgi:tRNA(Ile)-lysidine synthase